jgi:curved DNA-binding protein CbpA
MCGDNFRFINYKFRFVRSLPHLNQNISPNEMNWDPKMAPKLDFNEDYYSVLEVPDSIDPKDLKKAYYKIVFQYHPDRKSTEEEKSLCNKQMMVINNAYKILKDPTTRKEYDIKRKPKLNSDINNSFVNQRSKTTSKSTTENKYKYKSIYEQYDNTDNYEEDDLFREAWEYFRPKDDRQYTRTEVDDNFKSTKSRPLDLKVSNTLIRLIHVFLLILKLIVITSRIELLRFKRP